MQSKLKFENGKLIVSAEHAQDGDGDGKSSVKAKVEVEIDPVEVVGEIMKKDLSFLESIVAAKKLELGK